MPALALSQELVLGGANVQDESKELLESIKERAELLVVGGDPQYAYHVRNPRSDDTGDTYRQWAASVPALPGLCRTPDLRPLSELVKGARGVELDSAIREHIETHGIPLKDPKPIVMKNATVHLYGPGGLAIGASYSGSAYYWPKLRSSAQKLELVGAGEPLQDGDRIVVKTPEKWAKDTWKDYNRLGAFGAGVYYWNDSGDKTTWVVRRTENLRQGAIQYDEPVVLENVSYKQNLVVGNDSFLWTKADGKSTWTFRKP